MLFIAARLSGANSQIAALLLTAVMALMLGAWIAFSEQARRAIGEGGVLIAPAVLFLLTLAAGLWSLGPWTPGGALPVWEWSGGLGASTLDRGATLTELVKLAGLACVFLIGFIQGAKNQTARATLRLLLILCASYAFLSLVEFLADGQHSWQVRRLKGGFLSANTTATLLGMFVVLATSWVVQGLRADPDGSDGGRASARITIVAPRGAVMILLAGCLVLTASRAAMAVTALSVLAYAGWEFASGGLRRRTGAAFGVAGLGYLLVLLAGAGAAAIARFDKLATDLAERSQIFSLHWKMFLASPLFGWGMGTFDQINQQIITSPSYGVLWRLRATHNVVLQWLEEAGLVGAIPMFLCIVAVIGLTAYGYSSGRRQSSWLKALLVANAVVLLHGMSDFALQVPAVSASWTFLLGLQLSMAHPLRRVNPRN